MTIPDMSPAEVRRVLARNVERYAAKKGWIGRGWQSQLAGATGIAHSHITRLMDGSSAYTVDRLADLARALDVEPWELLVDDEATRRSALERILSGR